MESNGAWGSNGLTSVGCGGVWGNSGATGGSIWGAGGSSKRPSGDVWSGMESDSKPEGSKWRNLPADGPRNGSPGDNIGASAIPDGDVDRWGQSSRHSSTGSWGSASMADAKEVSGWGSPDPSPVPNAGTESWGFRSGANGGQVENSMSGGRKLSGDAKPSLGTEKNSGSNYLPPENPPGESSDVQSAWNRCGPALDSSQGVEGVDATQGESANKSILQISAVATTTGASSGAVAAEDSASEQEPRLSGDALSREEIIRRAVNSHERWGTMPVRQDTAWNIDDEPKKPFLVLKLDELTAERNQRAVRDPGNRQSWGQGSELPGASIKGHPDGGMWGSSVSDSLALGNVGEAGSGAAGAEFGGKPANMPDKLLSETGWSLRPAGGKDVEWGPGLGVAPWDASDAARVNKAGSAESGTRAPSLTRSASASTWSSEESDWSRGDPKDKAGSIWNSDSTDPRNWKPGFKPTTPLPPENVFNVPPPPFGASDYENLVGGLGNPSKQAVTGGSSDKTRVLLLQQLLDMGFKKEDAQAALISNNLNVENAISKLLASRLRSAGMDSDGDQMAARRQFPGGKPVGDLSMLSRADFPPDVAACLMSLMQNSQNPAPPLGQLGSHLGGARGAPSQYRPSGAGSVPPFSSNPLGMLSPNVPPAVQQKMLQPGLRADGNQTALQHQLLQQHLLQNVQSAIQANLIPPQLITAQSLTPTVLVKVQHMMEMYQTLQGLMSRYQLMVQENIVLLQSRQRPQNLGEIELIMTTFKQQICATQQQVLRELAVLQPPQPASTASGMDGLLKNFAGLQAKDDPMLAAAAAGLANPWKVGPPGDDPSGFLGQMATSNPNLLQHSISMSSGPKVDSFRADRPWMQQSGSCWSRPDLGRGEEAEAFLGGSYSSADGSGPSVANCGSSSLTGSEDGGAADLQLEIAEFIPGKPWQGLSAKGADDDPHLALGGEAPSSSAGILGSGSSHLMPGGSSGFSGMSKSSLGQKVSPWSPVDSSMSADLWAKSQGVPPGMTYNNKMPYQQQQQQQDQALNCSGVWSSNDQSSYKHLPSNSPSLPSNWLKLKNVSQVDMRMLEALCEQHGHVECFVPSAACDSAVVKYTRLDDACKAQKLLGLCSPRVGHPLAAEFLNKFEVFQMLQQQAPGGVQSRPHAGSGGPYPAPGLVKSGQNPGRWGAGPGDGGAGPWGDEHGLYLANNKLFQ